MRLKSMIQITGSFKNCFGRCGFYGFGTTLLPMISLFLYEYSHGDKWQKHEVTRPSSLLEPGEI